MIMYYMEDLTLYEFIKYTRYDHFTLKDFDNMKVGDKIEAVIWDSNFEETDIWRKKAVNERYPPSVMFEKNIHTLTKTGSLSWDITFHWGETFSHNIWIDVSHLPTRHKWCVVDDNGECHITSEYLYKDANIPIHWKSKHFNVSSLPKNIRVGWRGAIMLSKHLEKYDNNGVRVFYN